MVLASEVYQKEDYIRDYQGFLEFRNEGWLGTNKILVC